MLLATLALRVGKPVERDELITAIWPDDPPPSAQATLRGYVKRLRRVLMTGAGEEISAVRATDGGYVLCLPEDNVDLVRFRRLVALAAVRRDVYGELPLLQRALALWRGPAFVDVSSPALRPGVVNTLHEEYLRAREREVEIRLRLGQYGWLIPELAALVADNPLRETLWYQLVLALHLNGRQAEALAHYESLRELLADSLGTDPSPLMRDLHQRILSGKPMRTAC
ncbi:AfsR/SARP family transcriptional regulator [Amycolatopsis aidingensis]|uniref:AfsR/SARP family transcriptional regulator n=1 Tax=Amycolatopsis aidingensis TaxID=2842453 RepID=UPI001C0DA661|nr:AfsR/SARP family transcriptional regulator [Amycolatopsis aidingensis]